MVNADYHSGFIADFAKPSKNAKAKAKQGKRGYKKIKAQSRALTEYAKLTEKNNMSKKDILSLVVVLCAIVTILASVGIVSERYYDDEYLAYRSSMPFGKGPPIMYLARMLAMEFSTVGLKNEIPRNTVIRCGDKSYTITEELSDRPMSSVYEAVDSEGERVILKFPKSGAVKPFFKEATTHYYLQRSYGDSARLPFPRLYTTGHDNSRYILKDDNYGSFIVMQKIDGVELQDSTLVGELRRGINDGDPKKILQAKVFMLQVFSTLKLLHDKNILHRDLKPDNFLVDERSGQIYLIDFGIAETFEAAKKPPKGITSGTVDYMSPETVLKEPEGEYSELFSLGVMFSMLFFDHYPFDSDGTPAPISTSSDIFQKSSSLLRRLKPETQAKLRAKLATSPFTTLQFTDETKSLVSFLKLLLYNGLISGAAHPAGKLDSSSPYTDNEKIVRRPLNIQEAAIYLAKVSVAIKVGTTEGQKVLDLGSFLKNVDGYDVYSGRVGGSAIFQQVKLPQGFRVNSDEELFLDGDTIRISKCPASIITVSDRSVEDDV